MDLIKPISSDHDLIKLAEKLNIHIDHIYESNEIKAPLPKKGSFLVLLRRPNQDIGHWTAAFNNEYYALRTAPLGRPTYLLFFDGGSRDNPGPGGSGSVVIQVGSNNMGFDILWVSSMSYANKAITNNIAENMGLLYGLKACARHKWFPIHVIGDSQLIIWQQAKRSVPKTKHLKPLYWQIRCLTDGVGVMGWHHHRRHYNKMADLLANIAMDSRRSTQFVPPRSVCSGSQWEEIYKHAPGDIGHWSANYHHEAISEAGASPP